MADTFWERDWVQFTIALTLFLVVIVAFAYLESYLEQGELVAEVNGEHIYREELNNRTIFSAINDVLLRQAADSEDITVSDGEVDRALNETAATHGLSREAFIRAMENQGYSRREIRQRARDTVRSNKLLQQEATVNVTDDELRQYYEANTGEFTSERRVTAMEVGCANCTYNISEYSGLSQDFLDRLFNASVNDTVRYNGTQLRVTAVHEPQLRAFETVQEELRSVLERRRQDEAVRDYLAGLRDQAEITNYVLDEVLQRDWTCLRNATLYGASWDSQTQEQLEQLGDIKQHVEYVECSGENFASAECARRGISAFPTWVIDGREHPGLQSKDRLYALAC